MTGTLARIEGAIRLLYPDEMTPTAYRVLTNILESEKSTEPSHTGAAPVTSGEFEVGDWVRVIGPDYDRRIGKVGVVRILSSSAALIDFPGMQAAAFSHGYLEPAPTPDASTPRH